MQLYLRKAKRCVSAVTISQARGGEGCICAIVGERGRSLKKYNDPVPDDLEPRLQYMMANPPYTILNQLAWPEDIVEDGRGAVVGYLQRHFAPKYISFTAISSPRTCPRWVRPNEMRESAYQAAFLVAELHAHDYLFADIHGEQFLVARRKPAVLIDTASCQFSDAGKLYPCVRVRDEYQAPELFGATDWAQVAKQRDERTDSWSLAVLEFQLTLGGCHPFDGIYVGTGTALPVPERAKQGHFPFDSGCRDYRPPLNAPPYRTVSPELRDLFFRCFVAGHRPENRDRRPAAAEWADVLRHCPCLRSGPQPRLVNTSPRAPHAFRPLRFPLAVDACRQALHRALGVVSRLGWMPVVCLAILGIAAASYYAMVRRTDRAKQTAPQVRVDRSDVQSVLDRIREQIADE